MKKVCIQTALTDSAQKANPIVLTTKTEKGWNLYKSQFKTIDLFRKIICEVPEQRYGFAQRPSGSIGVSFRLGHKKLIFHTECHDNVLVWPQKMAILSRTSYEPYEPPNPITVRLRRFDDDAQIKTVHHAQLINISAGGMKISIGDTPYESGCYTCIIDSHKLIKTDAITRNHEEVEGRIRMSFQFVGLEFDDEGQKNLKRLAKLTAKGRRKERRRLPRAAFSSSVF